MTTQALLCAGQRSGGDTASRLLAGQGELESMWRIVTATENQYGH